MAVAVQLSVLGLYLPPVFKLWVWSPFWLNPPHIIISLPVHTAVCLARSSGAFRMFVGVHVSSVQGEGGCAQYLPPVLKGLMKSSPPQTIIWLPVHTAV